jgi:predicted HD superfamily hydrolase involved in NAD metabolism
MSDFLLYLSQRLTPPRLQHSQGVMRVMADLVNIYGLDRDQAVTAGLLHDSAKDLNPEQLLALADAGGIELFDPCDRHPVYLHALVGAYLAQRDLQISDQEVLRAIAAHSYARNGLDGNTRLLNCLRVADILAPVEAWEGIQKLKRWVYAGRLDEAVLLHCAWSIDYFQEIGAPLHPNLRREYAALSTRLAVDDTFFSRADNLVED